MAVINDLNIYPVVPSKVFGWEVNTDVGYGRETVDLTIGSLGLVRVGTVLEIDYSNMTAEPLAEPQSVNDVDSLGDLGIFVGRDTTTNPATAQDFDRLTTTEDGSVVVIVKGDGRGTLYKKYLDFSGTGFYELSASVQQALIAKFTKENRFKVLDQV